LSRSFPYTAAALGTSAKDCADAGTLPSSSLCAAVSGKRTPLDFDGTVNRRKAIAMIRIAATTMPAMMNFFTCYYPPSDVAFDRRRGPS
jgi:hypothetical protein